MNRLSYAIISVGLIAISASNKLSAQALGIKGESHSSVGIYIRDLAADTIVAENDADRNLAPASILKSLTSATALSSLGRDFRFKTTVKLVGDRDDDPTTWRGDLVIVPSGDPTIESGHFASNKGLCDSIVANISRLGIQKITGKIKVPESQNDFGPIPQWEIDDVAWPYGAALYEFNYKDNVFTLSTATNATTPHVPNLDVTTIAASSSDLLRGANSNKLYVYGGNFADKKSRVSSTMPHPADVFVCELTEKLKAAGIKLDESSSASSAEAVIVYKHTSPKLISILQSLMERSDNMFAEGTLRAVTKGKSRSEAIRTELGLWRSRGLETDYVTVRDGSGLSRVNRVSARFMGDMLAWMARSKMCKDYTSLFPIAGKTGTVKSFMLNTRLSGKLILKTGSMNGVQCYAGYKIDDSGKPTHVVVIMVNSFFCPRADLRTAISNFLLNNL
jgi:D-alanyl-D-alanine carboxypeptidase/D-alanyl-D-alanine-endopeptidase (penicillin-binding protein 4)